MNPPKHKVKLSRKMMLGVGRSSGRGSLLPYATLIFFVISGVLGLRAGYMVIRHTTPSSEPSPQVLGAVDNPSSKPAFQNYSVKKGDTVFSIAQAHNLDWTALATLNSLQAPFSLKPGQTIQIPQQ